MKYLYLFGYPLGHSISPAFQNAALRACGVRRVRYVKNPMPPDKFQEIILALRAPHCLGANITVPYKQTILPLLDEVSPLAREIGAVNTVVKRANADGSVTLVGENTDAYGFMQALRARRVNPRGQRVAILGAGGAAAAAAYALAEAGAHEIILLNRTLARSIELADRLVQKFRRMGLAINDWDALGKTQLLVNATSVGMSPHPDASPLPPHVLLAPHAVVYDLVYNPPMTRFLREAQAQGARIVGGLEMLIYQGARAFELWTGKRAPVRIMRASAARALEEMIRAADAGHKG